MWKLFKKYLGSDVRTACSCLLYESIGVSDPGVAYMLDGTDAMVELINGEGWYVCKYSGASKNMLLSVDESDVLRDIRLVTWYVLNRFSVAYDWRILSVARLQM